MVANLKTHNPNELNISKTTVFQHYESIVIPTEKKERVWDFKKQNQLEMMTNEQTWEEIWCLSFRTKHESIAIPTAKKERVWDFKSRINLKWRQTNKPVIFIQQTKLQQSTNPSPFQTEKKERSLKVWKRNQHKQKNKPENLIFERFMKTQPKQTNIVHGVDYCKIKSQE